jgi:hypothetical protein
MVPSPLYQETGGQYYIIWRCDDCDFNERANVNPDPEANYRKV